MALTTLVLHETVKSSVDLEAVSVKVPDDLTNKGLIALGAQHYSQVCSSSHGGPGLGQSPEALSMRPRPQALTKVVDQFTDAQLFVILRDGVRFSAMPATRSLPRTNWQPSTAKEIAAAASLAKGGYPARSIAACTSCHADATSTLPLIPHLNGQESRYIFKRLQYFSEPGASEVMSPMPHIAQNLTTDERHALANYFADKEILTK